MGTNVFPLGGQRLAASRSFSFVSLLGAPRVVPKYAAWQHLDPQLARRRIIVTEAGLEIETDHCSTLWVPGVPDGDDDAPTAGDADHRWSAACAELLEPPQADQHRRRQVRAQQRLLGVRDGTSGSPPRWVRRPAVGAGARGMGRPWCGRGAVAAAAVRRLRRGRSAQPRSTPNPTDARSPAGPDPGRAAGCTAVELLPSIALTTSPRSTGTAAVTPPVITTSPGRAFRAAPRWRAPASPKRAGVAYGGRTVPLGDSDSDTGDGDTVVQRSDQQLHPTRYLTLRRPPRRTQVALHPAVTQLFLFFLDSAVGG